MPSTQTVSFGPHAAAIGIVERTLEAEQILARLWSRDAALWSEDPAIQRLIRQRLGWLSMPAAMAGGQMEALRRCAQEVRAAGLTQALLLGMGGSGLFPEVCRGILCRRAPSPRSEGVELAVLDTTDPAAIREHQRRCPAQHLALIIASKSGTTVEVNALSRFFEEALQSAGLSLGAHGVVITDAGTPLQAHAEQWGARWVFLLGPENGRDVGGRFSALTFFGLVPAALMGVDAARLLERAQAMLRRCGPEAPTAGNPAVQLGAALATLAQHGRDKLTLLASPSLERFGAWAEQLIAESLGKMGRGVVPVIGEPAYAPEGYGSDRWFVDLRLAAEAGSSADRAQGLEQAGHPVVRIRWDDPYDLGGEVVKWSVATAIAGTLLGVNPFDEPDVQESKDRTTALLEQHARHARWPDEAPVWSGPALAVYGGLKAGSAASLDAVLAEFVRQWQPRNYFGVLSFLPRTAALDRAVAALRERLGWGGRYATVLGIGPRYLHSTGQLFKGGTDAGLFLLLTAEEPEDLPVPGEPPMTFGTLKRAQALGDFLAMRDRGRRVLRLHFLDDAERGLAQCAAALTAPLAALPTSGG